MHQELLIKNKVHYLTPQQDVFEKAYIAIREREGRVLSDEEVLFLPHLPIQHPKRTEWQKRNFTLRHVLPHIATNTPSRLLDLGCGNGWFTNKLAQTTTAEVIGSDVNVVELEQAARLFSSSSCHFMYADVFSDQWKENYFDSITLNACVQYFPDLDVLLAQLFRLLAPKGEIHLLDSPFYLRSELAAASQRTADYYQQQGVPEMSSFYHHHSWTSLDKYKASILYQPTTFFNKIKRKMDSTRSPFPWVLIRK